MLITKFTRKIRKLEQEKLILMPASKVVTVKEVL